MCTWLKCAAAQQDLRLQQTNKWRSSLLRIVQIAALKRVIGVGTSKNRRKTWLQARVQADKLDT